jgi:hypothetical protein
MIVGDLEISYYVGKNGRYSCVVSCVEEQWCPNWDGQHFLDDNSRRHYHG